MLKQTMKNLNYCIILLFIFNISFNYTFSQSTQIIGDANVNEYAYAVARDLEGNSYLGGVSNQDGLLTKVDSLGSITWSKKFGLNLPPSQKINVSYLEINSDTLFGCGWITSGILSAGAFYFKMNKNTGNFYWMHSETSSSICYSSMRYDAGKYFLVGARAIANSTYDGKVLCVNALNGNIIWQNGAWGVTFPIGNTDFIDDSYAMTSIQNGKFFVSGRSYLGGTASNNDMRVTLIGFDLTGNIICNKYLLYPENSPGINRFYGLNIEFDGPDSLVIAFFGDDNCTGSCNSFKAGLVKTDINGNVSFSKTYDITSSPREYVKSLNITNDAYVIFGGANFSSSNSKLFAIKTDKNGVFETARLISKTGSALPITMGSINLGGSSDFTNSTHSFVASTHTGNTNDRDMILIRMNEFLNSENPCFVFNTVPVVTQIIPPFSGTINIINKTNTVSPNTGVIDQINTFSDLGCSSSDIVYQETLFGCDSANITASSLSGIAYSITWGNGIIGNTSTFYTDTSSIIEFYNPIKCCFFFDTVQINLGLSMPNVLLPNDTSICIATGSTFDILSITTNCSGCSYLWNDASTGSLLTIDTSGWYSIIVTNNCGNQDEDSIFVIMTPLPELSLINDTLICPSGFPITITTSGNYLDSLVWSNGTSGINSTYLNTGVEYVEAFSTCGNVIDTFFIDTVPSVSISSVNNIDTCLLSGQSVTIPIVASNFDDIFVNGINTAPILTIFQDSSFSIFASNSCSQDSIQFSIIINEIYSYIGDTNIDTCLSAGNSVDISVNVINGIITWWNGSQLENQSVTNSGTYYYNVSNTCGSVNDSVIVIFDAQPQSNLVDIDTCIITDDGIYLTSPSSTQTAYWTNSGTDSLYVTESGVYYAEVISSCGTLMDSVVVSLNQLPYLSVSDTIHVCKEFVSIHALGVNSNYLVNISSITGSDIGNLISEEGEYLINLVSSCGSISQPIYLIFDSDINFYAPNSFTPDGDQFNNLYEFKGDNYRILDISIYNRWGERVYFQAGAFDGWDGTYNGWECQSGTYIVKVKYTSCSQIEQEQYLHVNLLR